MEHPGKRITLRPITMDDLDVCARWAQDEEVMHHVLQRTLTLEEEREWLEGVLKSDTQKIFMILNEERKPVGTCGMYFSAPNPDLRQEEGLCVGIMLGEKTEWGKGYGPEALRVLADMAHAEYGAARVWLTVDTVHARAIRAYEKAGFRPVREIDAADRMHTGGKQLLMEIRHGPHSGI